MTGVHCGNIEHWCSSVASTPTLHQDLRRFPMKHIPGLFVERFWLEGSEQDTVLTTPAPRLCASEVWDWVLRIGISNWSSQRLPIFLSPRPYLASCPCPRPFLLESCSCFSSGLLPNKIAFFPVTRACPPTSQLPNTLPPVLKKYFYGAPLV